MSITRIARTGDGNFLRGLAHGSSGSDDENIEHFIFSLNNVHSETPERVVAMEGYYSPSDRNRGVGTIRFETSTGRKSPWYGRDRGGTYFRLSATSLRAASSKRTTDTGEEDDRATNMSGWIVGFCGRASADRLLEVGIVAHQKLPCNILGNCWVGSEEEKFDFERAERKAENEFAVLLRMRASDVSKAMNRAVRFALRARATKTGLPGIDSIKVTFQIARWFFESQCYGLVRCPNQETYRHAESLRFRGQALVKRGEASVSLAENLMRSVEGYDPHTGVANIDVAMMGMAKVREFQRTISEASRHKKKGLVLIARGQALTLEADSVLPAISSENKRSREYFEKLCELSHVANTLTDKEQALLKTLETMGY